MLNYQQMSETIKRSGRQLIGVLSDPAFIYTIGHTLQGMPELLIIGNASAKIGRVINILGNMQAERKEAFQDGEIVDIGGLCPVKMKRMIGVELILAKSAYTIQAGQFLGHENYEVTQVLVPDKKGIFPDDPLCDATYQQQRIA